MNYNIYKTAVTSTFFLYSSQPPSSMPQFPSQGSSMILETPEGYVWTNLHYIPIVGFLLSCIAILVPYCIAVYVEDVPAFLPFISDAGGDPPQSIIFGVFFGMMSFIGNIIIDTLYLTRATMPARL